MLSLELKVPSNARAFSIKAYFLSSEYPEYVCSPFNDLFVALLDSAYDAEPENPPDKNLAVHREGDETFPIGVNLAASASSLFSACVAGETGCVAGAVAGEQDSCKTSAELAGTGFDVPAPGKCGEDAVVGGGTGWLELHGNVVPGESAKLRLIIWDTADHITDSLVLLDDFEWLPLEASAGVKLCPGCEVSAE